MATSTRIEELLRDAEGTLAEIQTIESTYGTDAAGMPAGQAERHRRLTTHLQRTDAEVAELVARAERLEQVRAAAQNPKKVTSMFDAPEVITRTGRDPWSAAAQGIVTRDVALDAIERAEGALLADADREQITRTVETDATGRAAQYVAVASDPAYERAFLALAKDPVNGHRHWTGEELAAFQRVEAVRASMSLTDGNGGYLVPFTLDPAILLTNTGALNPIREVARKVQITTDVWHGVASAGVTAEWLAEASEAADASPTFTQPSITAHKGAAYVQASMEVAGDSTIAQQIGALFADARNRQEAAAFTLGTGTGQPHGVVDALIDATKIVTSAAADTFGSADVYALMAAVPARWRPGMVLIADLATIFSIAKFESAAGARLFPEVADGRILNRRLIEVSGMDGVVNAGAENYILAAFDPQQYVVVDRLGSTVIFDNNVRGANQRPTGEVSWTLFYRTGADLVVTDAGRVLNVT